MNVIYARILLKVSAFAQWQGNACDAIEEDGIIVPDVANGR